MAKVHKAAFAQDPQNGAAVLTAAGSMDGSNAVLVYTARDEGAIINGLKAAPRGMIVANGVVFFKEKAGTTVRVAFDSLDVPGWDPVVTTNLAKGLPIAASKTVSNANPEHLGRGDKVYACLMSTATNGIGVNVVVQEFEEAAQ